MITLIVSNTEAAARPGGGEQPGSSLPMLPSTYWMSGTEAFSTLTDLARAASAHGLEGVAVKKVRFCTVEHRQQAHVSRAMRLRRVAWSAGVLGMIGTAAILLGLAPELIIWLATCVAWLGASMAGLQAAGLTRAANRCTAPAFTVIEEGRLEKKAAGLLFDEYQYRAVDAPSLDGFRFGTAWFKRPLPLGPA